MVESTTCFGFAWMDFAAERKSIPEMRCYGLTRTGSSFHGKQRGLGSLSLGQTGSLKAFGCVGSTSIVSSSGNRHLRYKGVAIEVHESKSSTIITEDEDDNLDLEEVVQESAARQAWNDLSKQALEQGYSSTPAFFSHRVLDRTLAILKHQGKLLGQILTDPIGYSQKVTLRTFSILNKAGSIATKAAFLARKFSSESLRYLKLS